MTFDWKSPEYGPVFLQRLKMLEYIRENPDVIPGLKAFYRENPADFINDFGVTFDPRNAERGLPTVVPFVLFPKQREWVEWVVRHWREQTPGLTEKSRDMGVSWLSVATACTLCLFYEGLAIGFGSRLVDYVDKIGTMKPLLPKARMFMEHIPEEFRGGWVPWRDAPYMRLNFPETGSIIMGEGGDQIGRGDRASIYLVDEAAYLERAELVEQSLSQTTNCRIDVSSVRQNTLFATKRWSGKVDVFIFDWHDDPRKDQKWYDLLAAPASEGGKGLDEVTIAQEVDRDYSASVEGILIPSQWVRAAIDARTKLGMPPPSGARGLALDVADEGIDKNAVCGAHGTEIEFLDEWSGKGADLYATTERTFRICDDHSYDGFRYDADGLGAGIRGDARTINERRQESGRRPLKIVPFRSSDAVFDPDGIVDATIGRESDKGRTNKDYFANRKAQAGWSLRRRFYMTYRWVVKGIKCAPDDTISINSKCPLYMKLVTELSQPTFTDNGIGKIVINKKPYGMPSPNLFDAVMIKFAQIEAAPMRITQDVISQIMRAGAGRRR